MMKILLTVSLLLGATSAWACPCNDKPKAACACGSDSSCPSTCTPAEPQKTDGKKPAPRK